jgi:hypothetical protein
MRPRAVGRILWLVWAFVALLVVVPAFGADADKGREHFQSGVKLFETGDYATALTEFEASNVHRPSASALQNIVLCLTKLHRYLPALETLDELKTHYSASMSAEDKKAVNDSIQRLSRLVGTLTLHLKPAGAKVTLDDKGLGQEAITHPIRVASGEHRIRVEATLFRTDERTITIAGGDDLSLDIDLKPETAEVSIFASDPAAAIAIDRMPVALGTWSGPLAPGNHLVQVYKKGYESFASWIPVHAGDRIELRPALGPATKTQTRAVLAAPESKPGAPADSKQAAAQPPPRGWYGLASADLLAPLAHPDLSDAHGAAGSGGALGLRAGYRFWQNIALEAMLHGGKQGPISGANTSYTLETVRFGANARLLAGGRVARFSAVFGAGAATHTVTFESGAHKGMTGKGTADLYFFLECAVQFNVGKVLLELAVPWFVEGASNVKAEDVALYQKSSFIPQMGIGFRVGYSGWGEW